MLVLAAAVMVPRPVAAQALHSEKLAGGTEVVLVSLPLSQATTVAWPAPDGTVVAVSSGDLTLAADVEASLGGLEVAPPVVVAVGGVGAADLRGVLERSLAGRPLGSVATAVAPEVTEGGVERRLGAAGTESMVRLELPVPPPGDWRRSAIEVLWEMLPRVLATRISGLSSRVVGGVAVLETTTEAELAEVTLRDLRLQLARIAAAPELDEGQTELARRRVEVRRLAILGNHPDGARELVELWMESGVPAIRERLFGAAGVTLSAVREAAARWLPLHPGRGVLVLPPRVFNPRFAPGPHTVQLDNDAMAAVLERPGAGLSAVVVRPVLVPDLDGSLSSLVLARLATEVRSSEMAPGWIRVRQEPPLLELAAPPEALAEVLEVLQPALERVAGDEQPVAPEDADARQRALRLMATLLGLGEASSPTPARLLRSSNLALGVVAMDAEAAEEALRKFRVGGSEEIGSPGIRQLAPVPRTREAAPGGASVLVVALDLDPAGGEVVARAVEELLRARAGRLGDGVAVELLQPLVPGRQVLLLVARGELPLSELEGKVRQGWQALTSPLGRGELDPVRRRLAADLAAEASGPLGAARRCAALAAGAIVWRPPADVEMETLGLTDEAVDGALAGVSAWASLQTTGAGVLPIPDASPRSP